jgi:hypothetical protein
MISPTLFPLFDQKNASIMMTPNVVVATNATSNTISFDDGENTTVDDVEIEASLHHYREGRGKYQFDYERLSSLAPHRGRAESVSVTPLSSSANH